MYFNMKAEIKTKDWNFHRPSRADRFVRFWVYGGAKFPRMGDSLPGTPINHRAKFDTASFIFGGEIRNRTNTHTQTKQTVTDISTPCLSACVDNIIICIQFLSLILCGIYAAYTCHLCRSRPIHSHADSSTSM